MSKEYEECWKYFKKDEGTQSPRCTIWFKSLQCKVSWTSAPRRHFEHIQGMKRTQKIW